jgi:hypothetical protein
LTVSTTDIQVHSLELVSDFTTQVRVHNLVIIPLNSRFEEMKIKNYLIEGRSVDFPSVNRTSLVWFIRLFRHTNRPRCRSQWPRGLRHELSSPARTMGSWVRIPPKAWMSVCVYSVFVLSYV